MAMQEAAANTAPAAAATPDVVAQDVPASASATAASEPPAAPVTEQAPTVPATAPVAIDAPVVAPTSASASTEESVAAAPTTAPVGESEDRAVADVDADANHAAAAALAALAAVEKAEAIAIEQARVAHEQQAAAAAAAEAANVASDQQSKSEPRSEESAAKLSAAPAATPEVKPTPPSRPAARPRTSLLQAALANAASPHRAASPPAVAPMMVEESAAAASSSSSQQQQQTLVGASTSPAVNLHLVTPSSGDWGAAGQLVTPAVAADFMPSEADAGADFSSTFALSTSMREVEPRSELQHSSGAASLQQQQQEQQEDQQTEAISAPVSDAEASDSDSDDEFFDAATYIAPKPSPPPLPTPTVAAPSPVAAAASTPTAASRPPVVRDRNRMSLIMFAGLKTPTAAASAGGAATATSTAAPTTAAPTALQVETDPESPHQPRPIAWSTAGSGLVHITFTPGPADTLLVGTFVDVHALPLDPEVAAAIQAESSAHATATAAAHAASAAFLTTSTPSSGARPTPASPSAALAGASTPFLISKEILDTETRFIEILSALVEVFVAPIQAASHIRDESVAGSVALDSRVQVLFATATQILKLNVRFMEEMRRVIEAWLPSRRESVPPMGCPSVGGVFLHYAPLFRIFSSYAKDHESVAALLGAALKNKGSTWEKFVSRASMDPRCKGQTLESMLIQPVQRIPRYKLLLEELKRKSSPDARGYSDLLASIAQVGEVALHVNETIRHREQNESLRQLEKCFSLTAATGFQRINLRDREPPRTLIKEGMLKRLTRKGHESYYLSVAGSTPQHPLAIHHVILSPSFGSVLCVVCCVCHCSHLFNDILLYSDQISVAGRSTQFKLHRRISFEDSIAITDKSTVKPAAPAAATAQTTTTPAVAPANVVANGEAAAQPTATPSDAKPLSTPASPALGAMPTPPATPSSVSVGAAAASPAVPAAAPATVPQYLIEIRSPAKSFIVSFETVSQKDSWLSALRECVRVVQESRGADSSAFVAPVWTQDQAERKCPSCSKDFSLFNRRHHCRLCGVLVCALCSKQKRMLPAVDKLKPVRVCDSCVIKVHATLKAQKDGVIPPHPAALSKRMSTIGSLLSSTQPPGSTKGAAVARSIPQAVTSEDAADVATGYGAEAVAMSEFDDTAPSAANGSGAVVDSVEIPLHRRTLFTLARTYRGNERLLNMMELYLSERTYCLELQVILSDFVIPLLKQIQTKKGMLGGAPTTQLLGKAVPPTLLLFLNSVQPLATLSRELLNCLHAKLILGEGVPESVKSSVGVPAGWHPRYTTMGELFLRYASLFELYVEYSQNHQQAISLLTDPREPFAKEVFAKYDAAIRTKMDELITATQAVNAKAKAQEEGWGREDDAARVAAGLLPVALQPEGAEEATSFLPNGAESSSSSVGGPTAANPAARRASAIRLSISGAPQPLVLDEPLPHTSLHDLLTAPFMRVSKYVWLLSSLLRATPEGHPDNIVPKSTTTATGTASGSSPTNSASGGSAAAVAPASPSSSAESNAAAASTAALAASSSSPSPAPPQQLASALKAVQSSLFLINAAILCGDNLDKLSKLQSDKFTGSAKELDLVAPNRHLLKEGYLLRHTRNGTTNYYFHLFSDMLTYSSVTVQGKYKLHRKLPLLTLQILDTGGSLAAGSSTAHLSAPAVAAAQAAALELEIRSPAKSFVVCAKTPADKEEWLEEVQLAVQAELRRQTMGGAAVAAANAADNAAAAAAGGGTPGLMRAASMVNMNGGVGGVPGDDPVARRESVMLASVAPVWTKDSALDSCSLCTKKFTLFNRRRQGDTLHREQESEGRAGDQEGDSSFSAVCVLSPCLSACRSLSCVRLPCVRCVFEGQEAGADHRQR